jgi:hypothetical protein
MAPRIDGGCMLKRVLAAVGRLAAFAERAVQA